MLFCSQEFILFFLGVFILYWSVPWKQARVGILLVASFVFYASWNHWLAILIVVTSTMDYLIALRMDCCKRPTRRKILLGLSIGTNLGVLCYFKYANFFLSSIEDALRAFGSSTSMPLLKVMVPLGISFYTFEAISYAVDVYGGKIKAERNLAHFMLFILFFPHLIAGPIVRGGDFLPQVRRKKRWNWLRINFGLQLFVLGMFKKIAIGDQLAKFVDMVYADPTAFSAPVLWLAVAAFAVQLYCDFSGYSDMALGTAHLLGYRLTWNFNLPFLATSMAEFWRRWHISLSNWIRDYIYIPLGGSRGSAWFNCRNLMLAMIFCGLWHEATAHDLVFGIVQGAILIACRQFRSWYKQRPAVCAFLDSRIGTACSIAFTLFIFSLSLIFFRTPNMSTAWSMFHGLFGLGALGTIPKFNYMLLACLFVIFGIGHWLAQGQRWRRMVDSMPAVAVGTGYTVVATAALILAPGLAKQFIYFQF